MAFLRSQHFLEFLDEVEYAALLGQLEKADALNENLIQKTDKMKAEVNEINKKLDVISNALSSPRPATTKASAKERTDGADGGELDDP